MYFSYLLPAILLLGISGFFLGRRKAIRVSAAQGGIKELHSLPNHYGMLTGLAVLLPALLIYGLWISIETSVVDKRIVNELPAELVEDTGSVSLYLNDIKNTLAGNVTVSKDPEITRAAERYAHITQNYRSIVTAVVCALMIFFAAVTYKSISAKLRARNLVETVIKAILLLCSAVAIFTTLGIVLSVLFEAIRFFQVIPLQEFLFGLTWSPQMAIRADQVGSSGAFGAVPIFAGTFMIAAIAMLVAIPIGLLSAIYLSEFANRKFRTIVKPMLEILAGIPTVVYGFFAALTVAPLIRNTGGFFGLSVASESAMA
ncbi:MAG: phosphate ABC transporter permease subunit PstC, partial [Desulfofustis sp.]|nr:phosphate ABC transporter permease subunit PstC [Desulfofustis sp.]